MKTYSWIQSFLLTLMALASVTAMASEKITSIPQIQLQNVTQSSGRAVTVFFASGRGASFTTEGGVPVIRTIKAGPVRAEVASNGSAVIDPRTIPRKGFEVLNYLVIVIHSASQQDVKIRNADGSAPSIDGISKGPVQDSPAFENDRIVYLRLKLNHSKKAVVQVGNVNVNSNEPVVLNLENP